MKDTCVWCGKTVDNIFTLQLRKIIGDTTETYYGAIICMRCVDKLIRLKDRIKTKNGVA